MIPRFITALHRLTIYFPATLLSLPWFACTLPSPPLCPPIITSLLCFPSHWLIPSCSTTSPFLFLPSTTHSIPLELMQKATEVEHETHNRGVLGKSALHHLVLASVSCWWSSLTRPLALDMVLGIINMRYSYFSGKKSQKKRAVYVSLACSHPGGTALVRVELSLVQGTQRVDKCHYRE